MSQNGNSQKPGFIERAIDKVKDAGASARSATASAIRGAADQIASRIEGRKARFEVADTAIEFDIDITGGTVWATQAQIAELFGKDVRTVSEHLLSAFGEGEISREATIRKIRIVRQEGSRQVEREVDHYNLDAILAVGTRARSPRATQFRQWAFRVLKEYIVQGYALNEQRLRDDPAAAQSLNEKVRELRFGEKNLYARVRDCVVLVASDYDGTSEQVRSFFAKMQDKFHYAACEKTAQQLLLTRADGTKERMGMTCQLNSKPTLADAKIAKNYLSEQELKLQMLAGEAFFIYVEAQIARNRTMTTAQLLAKIDAVFRFNEMPEFPGYNGPYIKPQVDAYVKQQYELFRSRSDQEKYNASRLDRPRA